MNQLNSLNFEIFKMKMLDLSFLKQLDGQGAAILTVTFILAAFICYITFFSNLDKDNSLKEKEEQWNEKSFYNL